MTFALTLKGTVAPVALPGVIFTPVRWAPLPKDVSTGVAAASLFVYAAA